MQLFSCWNWEIFKSSFFEDYLRTTAAVYIIQQLQRKRISRSIVPQNSSEISRAFPTAASVIPEAVVCSCFIEKPCSENIWQNSQENTCVGVSFLTKRNFKIMKKLYEKRDFRTSVSLWTLRNYSEQLFLENTNGQLLLKLDL